MPKFNEDNILKKSIVKSNVESSCVVCNEKTKYIDYTCEYSVCSTECYIELKEMIAFGEI